MTVTSRVVRNARAHGVEFHDRKQWGSKLRTKYQKRRIDHRHFLLPKRPVDTLVQHITVTHDTGDFNADMRVLEGIGESRFQSGISYNIVVSMSTGKVGLGQAFDAKGTHTVNRKNVPGFSYDQNGVSLGIAMLGMPGDVVSEAAKRSVAKVISALIDEKVLTRTFDYVPHSLFAAKDCPTDAVREAMVEIYQAAVSGTHR